MRTRGGTLAEAPQTVAVSESAGEQQLRSVDIHITFTLRSLVHPLSSSVLPFLSFFIHYPHFLFFFFFIPLSAQPLTAPSIIFCLFYLYVFFPFSLLCRSPFYSSLSSSYFLSHSLSLSLALWFTFTLLCVFLCLLFLSLLCFSLWIRNINNFINTEVSFHAAVICSGQLVPDSMRYRAPALLVCNNAV